MFCRLDWFKIDAKVLRFGFTEIFCILMLSAVLCFLFFSFLSLVSFVLLLVNQAYKRLVLLIIHSTGASCSVGVINNIPVSLVVLSGHKVRWISPCQYPKEFLPHRLDLLIQSSVSLIYWLLSKMSQWLVPGETTHHKQILWDSTPLGEKKKITFIKLQSWSKSFKQHIWHVSPESLLWISISLLRYLMLFCAVSSLL